MRSANTWATFKAGARFTIIQMFATPEKARLAISAGGEAPKEVTMGARGMQPTFNPLVCV